MWVQAGARGRMSCKAAHNGEGGDARELLLRHVAVAEHLLSRQVHQESCADQMQRARTMQELHMCMRCTPYSYWATGRVQGCMQCARRACAAPFLLVPDMTEVE